MSPTLHAERNGDTLLKPWGCVEVRFYPHLVSFGTSVLSKVCKVSSFLFLLFLSLDRSSFLPALSAARQPALHGRSGSVWSARPGP